LRKLEELKISIVQIFLENLSNLRFFQNDIQGDFEGYADISTCERTPQKVTIEPIIPYTNVEIYPEKGTKSFSIFFLKKWVKKHFFVLIQN
jgi:hypothetical protein